MTRIVYKIRDGFGEIRECSGDGLLLTVAIKPDTGGYVTLGGITKRLADGEARFNLERLSDGDYTPTLEGTASAVLEPVRKLSGRVFALPTPDSSIRRLLERSEKSEEKIKKLEGRLDELLRLIEGRIIF
ncbi:MAG: hypothetical protein IJW48_01975 [Clostridia bacterium]|nr:hypothetical protein [Clostridia bacterium]